MNYYSVIFDFEYCTEATIGSAEDTKHNSVMKSETMFGAFNFKFVIVLLVLIKRPIKIDFGNIILCFHIC